MLAPAAALLLPFDNLLRLGTGGGGNGLDATTAGWQGGLLRRPRLDAEAGCRLALLVLLLLGLVRPVLVVEEVLPQPPGVSMCRPFL